MKKNLFFLMAFLFIWNGAWAQKQESNSGKSVREIEEIIVTARKREESLLSVPVVVTAIGAREIDQRGVVNLDGIAHMVPQLMIGPQAGSLQGGNIVLRGISGPDTNPFGEEAVSFNIDGVQIAKGAVRRMSETDIAQVEVLKGPQALFFGKNSPAGIVSIRSADPDDHFQAKISTGYETEAREVRTEGYISGPLSETIGARLAGIYSDMDGWLKDQTPRDSPFWNGSSRNPEEKSYNLRGTLTWSPNDKFNARLKLNYGKVENNGPGATFEFISCPLGARQTGSDAQCEAGSYNTNSSNGPVLGTIPATLNYYGNGENFMKQEQILNGLELNYNLTDDLLLTSVTGYYWFDYSHCQNYENDFTIILPSCGVLKDREISQEFRITSNFNGPFNFTTGAYYADTQSESGSYTFLFSYPFDLFGPGLGGLDTPLQVNNYLFEHEGTSYSFFLQGRYELTDTVEIALGGRYSYEKKKLPSVKNGGGVSEVFDPSTWFGILDDTTLFTPLVTEDNWYDFSPEITISYRPSDDLTLFGSYKEGFLSGGFNSSSVCFICNPDLSYDPQTIDGYEVGLKARLFDRSLLVNVAAYTYDVQDLQVSSFTNATSTIRNAGAVEVEGVEADFTFVTWLEGLTIHGAAGYNHGRYSSYAGAPCYNGQSPAQGCNIIDGNPVQNLDGTELIRAPRWNLTGGFDYEVPLGDSGLVLGLSSDFSHSSSYLTDATSAPQGRSPAYTLIDAGIRLGPEDDRWTIALIGRNLTDEHYWFGSPNVPFTGSGQGTVAGPYVLGDRFATLARGREIMFRLSYMIN